MQFSSGRHKFLNPRPWTVIEWDENDYGEVLDRFDSKHAAITEQRAILADDNTRTVEVEFDPMPLDSRPLTNLGNPILHGCRGSEGVDADEAVFLRSMLSDDTHFNLPVHAHARAVLDRWAAFTGHTGA